MSNREAAETRLDNEDASFERYRRKNDPTLEEQREDEATMTLAELEERRDNLAEELKTLGETIATEITSVDDCYDEEQAQEMVQAVREGDDEPFTDMMVSEAESAINDIAIVLRQWVAATNAVFRRKAEMAGNNPPQLAVVE